MINDTVLAQLNVTDFFQNSNWLGKSPQLKHFSQKAIDPVAQLRLNLKEFFSQNNWDGSRNLIQHQQTEQDLSLTLSVQAYFQYQVWSGKPAVAVVPQIKDSEPNTKMTQKLKITDLSQLF
jgi:hypothetical protein